MRRPEADISIPPNSSVDELMEAWSRTGLRSHFNFPDDNDFCRYVLKSLDTFEKISEFADSLGEPCKKRQSFEHRLSGDNEKFWTGTVDRMRRALSHSRRVCCWCHETGSFAKFKR